MSVASALLCLSLAALTEHTTCDTPPSPVVFRPIGSVIDLLTGYTPDCPSPVNFRSIGSVSDLLTGYTPGCPSPIVFRPIGSVIDLLTGYTPGCLSPVDFRPIGSVIGQAIHLVVPAPLTLGLSVASLTCL